jgi:hypothetical protein
MTSSVLNELNLSVQRPERNRLPFLTKQKQIKLKSDE